VSQMNEQELDRAVREVIKRSVADADFRTKAIADGNSALAEVSDKSVPAGIQFAFVDNYSTPIKTIVLPDPVAGVDHLSEKDLEAVAGGMVAPCGATCGQGSCLST
jgi:hypothetical protein